MHRMFNIFSSLISSLFRLLVIRVHTNELQLKSFENSNFMNTTNISENVTFFIGLSLVRQLAVMVRRNDVYILCPINTLVHLSNEHLTTN